MAGFIIMRSSPKPLRQRPNLDTDMTPVFNNNIRPRGLMAKALDFGFRAFREISRDSSRALYVSWLFSTLGYLCSRIDRELIKFKTFETVFGAFFSVSLSPHARTAEACATTSKLKLEFNSIMPLCGASSFVDG
ncbi:unnamed protein product [Fusarium graminearum]|uniref:Uncharacterized protein n=1 Tax=Gibberella zeae TaxID=5518 RepID=A0A4E9E9Z8_GIBZA|nr:unnamed protein product [Fusarium graminearum]